MRSSMQCKRTAYARNYNEFPVAKMTEILKISATITERGQTIVPAAIRKMLALGKRDWVVFHGLANGTVMISKKELHAEEGDPVIGKFLEFLARDMGHEPGRIRPAPKSPVARGKTLIKGVKVDLNALPPEDDT